MRKLSLLLLGAALSGCTANDVTMGGAARHDYVMQTVDPDPQYKRETIEGGSGETGARAVEHYRKGTVTVPQPLSTTTGSSSGSGSGLSSAGR